MTVFTDNDFWQQCFHDRNISVLNEVPSEGPNISGIQHNLIFQPCPLSTEISPDSLNILVLWTIEDYSVIVPQIINIVFSNALFIPHHAANQLPIDVISCKLFIQLLLFSTFYFSNLLLPLAPVLRDCLECCCSQIQNELLFFMKYYHVLSFNISYVFFILLWTKYKLLSVF